MDFSKIAGMRKAIVPVLVGVVIWGLNRVGITEHMSVSDAVTFAVTAGLVWLVPNRP